MNRFKPFLFVFLAISFVFLIVVTFSLWADYWNACGAKGASCGTQGAKAACGAQGATAACATHGGSAMDVSGTQGSSGAAGSARQVSSTAGLLKPYFDMRRLLASDKLKGVDRLSKNLGKETVKLRKSLTKAGAPPEQLDALKEIESAASAMKTNDLKWTREGFKGLSRSILAYVKSYGCEGPAYSFYCDMVKESWLQETEKIGNPYYGSQMLKCGVKTGHAANGNYVTD